MCSVELDGKKLKVYGVWNKSSNIGIFTYCMLYYFNLDMRRIAKFFCNAHLCLFLLTTYLYKSSQARDEKNKKDRDERKTT
jgi:hypothetical protein